LHRDILTEDSKYSDKALNGQLIGGQTQSIDLEAIDGKIFGFYVTVQYHLSQPTGVVSLKVVPNTFGRRFHRLKALVALWQLANRVCNDEIRAVVKSALINRFAWDGVDNWSARYAKWDEEKVRTDVASLQKAYKLCTSDNIPFQDELVTALRNCPAQVVVDHVTSLDEDFKDAVVKAFTMQFADSQLAGTKGKREEEEAQTSATDEQTWFLRF